MAGPSELSGVIPGVVPGARGGDYSSVATGVAGVMQAIVQHKDQQQQQAAQKLDQMTKLIDAGLGPMIDVSQVPKLMKKMGIAVKKPEDMKAHLQDQAAQGGGGAQPQGAQPSQVQPTSGVQPQGAAAQGATSINKSQVNKENFKNSALQHWYDNAVGMAAKKGMTQQALADYSQKVAELKNKAAGDGPDAQDAIGKLMAMNEIPFSIDKAVWGNASDKQKQGIINVAAGAESEKDFTARKERIGESLITSGKFKDPEMAFRAGDALARGQGLPSDVKAAMAPNTFKELGEEAVFANQLIELGVPVDKVATTAQAARVGGLQNALPTGMKPLALQTLQEQQKRTSIEAVRVSAEASRARAEEERMHAIAAQADAKAKEEKFKENIDVFKTLVEMKKGGAKVDDQVLKAAQEKFAQSLGLDVKEVPSFWNWLTGGTRQEFSPRVSTEALSGAVGNKPKNKQQDPGTMNQIKKIFKALNPPKSN